ncbi:MAG: ATP-dependent helicase [Planctomycetaceae bacterium]
MDRLNTLNPPQRAAVLTLSGPLLVLAGAGTGKTRVITYRMTELIRRGTSPDRILSVTFTNKAAKEMQHRTAALLGRRLEKKPVISTFHALCVRILRQEITALGYPSNFTIHDRGDQEAAARTALRDMRVGEKSLRPGDLLARISRWKMAGVTPRNAGSHCENDLDVLAVSAYRRYQNNLRASGAVDFDDLLLLTHQLFRQHDDALERQQRRFDHVQIDEYQDTNGVQFELIEALVRPHRSLCVVGDDDQSIYGWRGAEVRHILNFREHFPDARVIRLEDNYRSTAPILELANRLVKHNFTRHDKQLRPHKKVGAPVRFLEFPDDTTEAAGVVGEISHLINEMKVPAGDIAILFRTNEQPRAFETEMRRLKVRYVLIGGQSFFDRREIKDLMAYLKAICQPKDEQSLLRIINTPARGIGTSTVQKLLTRAVRAKTSLWDAVPASAAAGELTDKVVTSINSFRHLLERYRKLFEEHPRELDGFASRLIEEIDYESEIEKQYKNPDQQLARTAVIDQFLDSMREYLKRSDDPSLAGFLEESALFGREDDDKDEQLENDGVRLMTLHSAKGLEFPHVYLVGLEEGLLPHQRSVEMEGDAIEEERRLAYVGVTRAMDTLTITRASGRMKWGKHRPSLPSRFLWEMRGEAQHAEEDERDDAVDATSAASTEQSSAEVVAETDV